MNYEAFYRLVGGEAHLGIAPVHLARGVFQAVLVWNDRVDLAVVPDSHGVNVFQIVDFRPQRYLGQLDMDAPCSDLDALYEFVAGLLSRCPRCGGLGEVPYSYSNEAGHWVRDWLPCPVCTIGTEEDALPF